MPEPTAIRVPQQARAKKRREALLRAAQVEFSTRGYAATTATKIAKRAKCSAGTFYQYFVDKDAALRELGVGRLEALSAQTLTLLGPDAEAPKTKNKKVSASTVRTRMRAVVRAVVDYHREDPGLHQVLTERRPHDEALDAQTTAAEHALVRGVAALLRAWGTPGDPDATAFVLFGMVEGSVHAHCLGHAQVDDARFESALVDALVRIATP